MGFWQHVRWYWRNRIRNKVVFWWHRHPWRSSLWKAHYNTHFGDHPWFLGIPRCQYCRRAFWRQNRHLSFHAFHSFLDTEIVVIQPREEQSNGS